MKQRFSWMVLLIGAIAVVVALVALPSARQTAPAGQAGPIPRSADGKPDFSGRWQAMTTANYDIQARSANKDGPAGLGVVEGNDLPYKPEALAQKAANFKNRATEDTESKCFLPGV